MRKWDIGSKSLCIPQMLNAIKSINGKVCITGVSGFRRERCGTMMDRPAKGGAWYMMFIKCRIKNYSDTAKRIRASVPATGNYMKDGRYVYEGDNTYFTCSKKIEFDPDVIQLNPGEEVTCVTGKLTYCHKKYWDIDKTDFYVRLCGRGDGISDPDKLDPRAGVLGKAVNILVKSSQIKKK